MKNFRMISLILLTVTFVSCLDSPTPSLGNLSDNNYTNQVISYISQKEIIQNLHGTAPFITATDLYYVGWKHILLDIRSSEDFEYGHIPEAINIAPEDIIEYLNNSNPEGYVDIIIISRTGQRASYLASLLILYGYENVKVLQSGMIYWNSHFSDYIESNIKTIETDDVNYPLNGKPSYLNNNIYGLPQLNSDLSSEQFIKNRIEEILDLGIPSEYDLLNQGTVFTNIDELYTYVDVNNNRFRGFTLACYDFIGVYSLYGSKEGYWNLPSHPIGAAYFSSPIKFDYRLDGNFQYIDPDQPIVFYSADGQSSAFLTGILRVLGYDAKSLLYGVHSFQYAGLINNEYYEVYSQSYNPEFINDYPYEEGNE